MSKLTLDEAIKHCLEVAEENEELSSKFDEWDEWEKADANNCRECAADHRQIAEWLTELKEAKRLLKQAVEDFSNMDWHIFDCDGMCNDCPLCGERDNCLKWRYADEALKLIQNS
jgi:hypothetical protein